MTINRRTFLKGLLSVSATAVIGPSLLVSTDVNANVNPELTEGSWRTSGSHWGAFRARILGGEVSEVVPFPHDKYPTKMLDGIKGMIYNPSRVRYPMVRLDWLTRSKNWNKTRGDNRFVRVTWDQALDLFYNELERVQKTYGPSALLGGQTGWRQTGQFHSCTTHMQRALAMHGQFVKKIGDYSTGAGQTILPYILGSTEVYAQQTSWSLVLKHAKQIIIWSNDPLKNAQVGWQCPTHDVYEYFAELKKKVASGEIEVISVDPVKSQTQNYLGCKQLYIHPQTDVPFMLAIAHTLYKEALYNKEFVDLYCIGFEDFIQYVMGKTKDNIEKTPEWASEICGIPSEKIREFSRMLARSRTQIMFGWCIQRQQHGEQPYWMGAVIASMLGDIGLPGGGVSYAHHYSGIGEPATGASGPGGFPRNLDAGMSALHEGDFKGYASTIPVARWIEAIEEPGKIINYNGNKVKLPPIKMVVVSGNNPWNHHQDHNRMKKAYYNIETAITIDYAWTASCRFSDIVLPACTQFERNDIDLYGAYSATGLLAMHKLVDPLYQSRTDFEIFKGLTARFGDKKDKEFSQDRSEMDWIKKLYNECVIANKGNFEMPDFNTFWKEGYISFGEGSTYVRHALFREDPELNPLGTPSGFIEISSRKIGSFGYKYCQEHPMWFEKHERSHGGPGSDKFPFWLQSCHPEKRLHSQMCESPALRATYTVKGREPAYLNPEDAKEKGIHQGDLIRVFNDRGQLIAGAVISENYPRGVIRIQEGAWYGPLSSEINAIDTYGDPNTVSLDVGTSELAQACSAYTCIVNYEKFKGTAPNVNVFTGPIQVKI